MKKLEELRGLVATVVLSGTVKPQYANALLQLALFNAGKGLTAVEYKEFYAVLVEAGRDSVVEHMLAQDYDYVLMIDGDAAPFPPDSLLRLLHTAFVQAPQYDVVGGYCQLKGPVGQPTIDTGTGTWEEHYPGEGLIPVIRTGGHFILCKRSAFEKVQAPWFRTRTIDSPAKALATLDNFARTRLGHNALAEREEWAQLRELASSDTHRPGGVGEDSGFFDALHAAGGRAAVDTDLVVGHVADEFILPDRFTDHQKKLRKHQHLALGVMLA